MFDLAWQLYEEAFPVEEKRSLGQQVVLLDNPLYRFCSIQLGGNFVGLMGFWQLPGVAFLEHFAVLEKERGKGTGYQALEALRLLVKKPLLLEVEPPNNDVTGRRIAFYQMAGFHLNPFPYQQPPYVTGMPWVPLQLMSSPSPLDQNTLEEMVRQLYSMVYQIQD